MRTGILGSGLASEEAEKLTTRGDTTDDEANMTH